MKELANKLSITQTPVKVGIWFIFFLRHETDMEQWRKESSFHKDYIKMLPHQHITFRPVIFSFPLKVFFLVNLSSHPCIYVQYSQLNKVLFESHQNGHKTLLQNIYLMFKLVFKTLGIQSVIYQGLKENLPV